MWKRAKKEKEKIFLLVNFYELNFSTRARGWVSRTQTDVRGNWGIFGRKFIHSFIHVSNTNIASVWKWERRWIMGKMREFAHFYTNIIMHISKHKVPHHNPKNFRIKLQFFDTYLGDNLKKWIFTKICLLESYTIFVWLPVGMCIFFLQWKCTFSKLSSNFIDESIFKFLIFALNF